MSRIPTRAAAAVVHLERWDSIDGALRRFKKNCHVAGIFTELKKRAFYVPRGARRRAKSQRAAKRRARTVQRQRWIDPDWKPERSSSTMREGGGSL